MYTKHYSLSQDPFSIAPDPRFLFMSERHREALAHLLYGVTGAAQASAGLGGGFVLLTGDIGTGKTTLCRCFLEQMPATCHVAYIVNPKLNVVELLQTICEEFRIALPPGAAASAKTCIDALNAFLLQTHAAGQNSVLVIDEAQNLAPDVLEQLRLLTNLETNERKLLQIVLIGQPELRSMLATPGLEQLAQRVIARYHLDALQPSETRRYIEHRLGVAGHQGVLPFDGAALKRIERLSAGVPRRINLLCGRALLGAWATGQTHVTRAVVNQAAAEVFGPDRAHPGNWLKPGLAGGVAVILVALAVTKLSPLPAKPARMTPATPAAASPIVTPTATLAKPALPIESLEQVMPRLATDMNTAWQTLVEIWQLHERANAPCQATERSPWLCHQANKLTLPQLRQLGRMGILTLHPNKGAPVFAVLVGLSESRATLQMQGQAHAVSVSELGKFWQGEFATFWKPPAGYTADWNGGQVTPALAALFQQLAQLEGTPTAQTPASKPVLAAELKDRVRAFQRTQGLTPDGWPGPLTFMQIEKAMDLTQPALRTDTP